METKSLQAIYTSHIRTGFASFFVKFGINLLHFGAVDNMPNLWVM